MSNLGGDNSSQKTRKIRYQPFLVLSNFTGFPYFVPKYFARDCSFQISRIFEYKTRLK